MKVLKKAGAIALAMALAVPAVATAPQSEAAAKKAPSLLFTATQGLPGSTQTLYVDKNNAKKIVKTTWSTSNKKVVTVSSKKKTTAKIKLGATGGTSAKVTAKVKYKIGKKTKTKKLTCKVKVVWLDITAAGSFSNSIDGNTALAVYFNEDATNINKYDVVPPEGEVLITGEWTTNVANVVEVTDTTDPAASGSAVSISRAAYANNRGPRMFIDLGKEITEKTSYHVVLKGFKGCGSKMILQTDIVVDPVKVNLSAGEYFDPEGKGNVSLTLKTDVPFNLSCEPLIDATETPSYITVKDESGNVVPVVDIIPTTEITEGDMVVINLNGGASSKKFTVEVNNGFFAEFGDPTKVYDIAQKTIVVDKQAPVEETTV